MNNLSTSLLAAHIAAGAVALLSGVAAALSQKRKGWHTRFGIVYVGAMFGVVVTSVPIAVLKSNPFLFLVALFSFQMTYSGWRTAVRKGKPGNIADSFVVGMALVWSACFIVFGIYRVVGQDYFGAVAIVFGAIGLGLARRDLKGLAPSPTGPKEPWIPTHLLMMGGALIATFTAALVVNAERLVPSMPKILVWLMPTIIGSSMIRRAKAAWEPKRPDPNPNN